MTKLALWDGKKITVRPSAVDGFSQCAYQWYRKHILGEQDIPGNRAAIGTAIHAAVENEWRNAMVSKQKDFNLSAMKDLAIAEFQELDAGGIQYADDENASTSEEAVIQGVETYAGDIVPFADIPIAVEQRFSINIDHEVVERVSGTVDYLSTEELADTKTSKRKPVPSNYETQQSIYKMLANENGYPVQRSMIHGVVLSAKPAGHILELTPNIPKAKAIVNNMLLTLDVMAQDIVAPEVLFRGNPNYHFCSDKYCSFFGSCPFVRGMEEPVQKAIAL